MRALVQRVSQARVRVDDEVVGDIGLGLVVLVGITHTDGIVEVDWMARKLVGLRAFEDQSGRMNLSAAGAGGAIMLVSQFTLYADLTRGMRPGFDLAAPATLAEPLYDALVERVAAQVPTATGRFGATMQVELVNEGPVTLWLERGAAVRERV